MKKIFQFYSTRISSKIALVMAACFYLIMSLYLYLGPATFSCGDSLAASPGDQTAGLIALNSIDAKDPWWGKSTVSNAPFGEVLGSAVHVTAQTLFIPYWLFSKLTGPVCAYNILSVAGFVFSATVMYLFVLKLLKRRSLALLAGFGFVFTPYLVTATGVHISYVFAGIFVLFAWAVLNFIEIPSKKNASLIGLVLGSYLYTDVYFIYLGGVLAIGVLIGICVAMLLMKTPKTSSLRQLFGTYKNLWAGLAVFVLLLVPLIVIRVIYSGEINSLVSSSRGDIVYEAGVYGARLREFLLPNPQQPELSRLFGDAFTKRDLHGSNAGEATLSLSLTLITINLLGLIKYSLARTRERPSPRIKYIFIATVVSGIVSLLFSLPPTLHGIPTPTYIVVSIVSIWRVFARLQVVINLTLVVSSIVALWYLLKDVKPKAYWIWYGVVFILVFFEYRTFAWVKPVWSYARDVPQAYYWLAQQNNIHRIAIYPLDEQSRTIYPTYYNSFQRIHHKETLNSFEPNSPQGPLRNALRDLDAPQTAPALRSLGIDAVVVNAPTQPSLPTADYRLLYRGSGISPTSVQNNTWVYQVLDGTRANEVLVPDDTFKTLNALTPTDVVYAFNGTARLNVTYLPKSHPCTVITSQFMIHPGDQAGVHDTIIEQGGHVLARIPVNDHTVAVTIQHTSSPIYISVANSVSDEQISNLQTSCTQ